MVIVHNGDFLGQIWQPMLLELDCMSDKNLLWDEQRILLKYSFHQTHYASQRPDKLGDGFLEEVP